MFIREIVRPSYRFAIELDSGAHSGYHRADLSKYQQDCPVVALADFKPGPLNQVIDCIRADRLSFLSQCHVCQHHCGR